MHRNNSDVFLRKHIIHVFNKLCIGKLNLTFLGLTNSILQIVIFEFCETKNSSTFEKFWLGPEAKDNTKEKTIMIMSLLIYLYTSPIVIVMLMTYTFDLVIRPHILNNHSHPTHNWEVILKSEIFEILDSISV